MLVKNNNPIINQLNDKFKAACILLGLSEDDINTKTSTNYTQKGIAIVSEYYVTFNDGSYKFTMQQNEGDVEYWYPKTVFVSPEVDETYTAVESANLKYDNLFDYYSIDSVDLRTMYEHSENISAHESDFEEVDLNGDGKLEKITIENLGYNGGDGGYSINVMSSDGKEIVIPGYDDENGFSFSLKKEANEDFKLFKNNTNESFDITCPTDYIMQYYNENSASSHKFADDTVVNIGSDMTSGYIVKDIEINGETKKH